MNKKKKTIYILMIAFIAILLSVGITFAALSYQKIGETQELIVGDIWMKYTETNELVLENAMPSETYDNTKYFEFKISGKNTYEKENILYDINLSYGEDHETRTERIRDDLLKFTLVEIKDGVETTVVDAASYDDLANQRIWISTIPMSTQDEIEITYRLYMWISNETGIGNTADSDYDMETWDKVFASIKVNVTGDFKPRYMVGADGEYQYLLLSNGKIQLTRYLGTETEVVIPATYDGYQVYSVGNPDANPDVKAERYNIFGATNTTTNTTVTKITLSEGIEVIGTAAFSFCTAWVGELELPSTLKEIGAFAFNHTENLTGDITIPEGVVKMGDAVFQSSKKYDGILTLPSTLQEIGTSTFNQLEALKNETIVIPKSLKIIGRATGDSTHTFYNAATKTLKEFVVDPENPYYKAIDGVLFSIDGTRLVSYPPNKEGNTYEIPEGVTTLDELAFSRAGSTYSNVPETGLKKLILPNSYALTTELPPCYLNTGNNLAVALYLYTGVNEIAVKEDNPNYKTEDGILYSKDGTTLWYVPIHKKGEINIPNGVTTIKGGSFYGTNRTQTIYIPASVTELDARAITELQNLTSSKVTFDPDCIYEFASAKVIRKKA